MKITSDKILFFLFGALLILFLVRAKQCRDIKESIKERHERECFELAWHMGYHKAFEEMKTGIIDTAWTQTAIDIETIVKKYK